MKIGIPILVVLVVLLGFVVRSLEEPKLLTEIKKRYEIIKSGLPADERWKRIKNSNPIFTGTTRDVDGAGSNVNKGYEIYICLDGDDVNSAVYVLIHELAHMSVPEYDHTDRFWTNFSKLKELCINNGLYTVSGTRTYCGDTIKDEGKA